MNSLGGNPGSREPSLATRSRPIGFDPGRYAAMFPYENQRIHDWANAHMDRPITEAPSYARWMASWVARQMIEEGMCEADASDILQTLKLESA